LNLIILAAITGSERLAAERGLYCVPHAWKTGLTVAATHHFPAAAPACPYAEFCHQDFFPSFLRSKQAVPQVGLQGGQWDLPNRPGMGVELDARTVEQTLAAPLTMIE
jgi:L-alanine-DL-glutamate epimerase-like enolase superfamily enzyme